MQVVAFVDPFPKPGRPEASPIMEADEDGRGLHLQPPAPSLPTSILSSSLSSTSDALPTSGDSNISLLPISVGGGNSDDHGSENLDEIDHQLGINFNHLLDIPFHQVPQSDHLQHDAIAVDNQTSSQHQIDLNLDALLSNAGTFYFRHSGHNYELTTDIFTSQIYRFLDLNPNQMKQLLTHTLEITKNL